MTMNEGIFPASHRKVTSLEGDLLLRKGFFRTTIVDPGRMIEQPRPGIGGHVKLNSFNFFFLFLSATLFSQEIIPGLKVKKDGTFETGDIRFGLQLFDASWNSTIQSTTTVSAVKGYPIVKNDSFDFLGFIKVSSTLSFALKEVIKRIDESSFTVDFSLENETSPKMNSLALTVNLPAEMKGKTLLLDGKPLALPVEMDEKNISLHTVQGAELLVPISTGQLFFKGKLNLLVQDSRKWKGGFDIRIYFSPQNGGAPKSTLNLTAGYRPFDSQIVPLRKAANMLFVDEVDGDKKGGWTDQGKENDLRQIKSGSLVAAGIRFEILDASGGNTCLVFGGRGRDYFPKSAQVEVNGLSGKNFYLLHATAWTPPKGTLVGNVVLTFADGSKETRSISAGVEVGDWWNATDLSNGVVVWNAANASSSVGLYASRFPIPEKPLKSVAFEASGNAVWMVVAATVSKDQANLQTVQVPVYVAAGPDWAPIADPRALESGSVLDFSFLQKETGVPAGQFGAVRVAGGHFEFENRPGVKARFAGGNLCFTANYLSHEQADALAERLARLGHNAVRIHHYEREMMDPNRPVGSQAVLSDRLDQLDYLIAAFKKKGIYITTDVFVSRPFRNGDIPGYDISDAKAYKALVVLGPGREDFKRWAKWLLVDHVNPYTGLSLGKDPVLATLSLVNEGNITAVWDISPATQKLANEMYVEWAKKNGLSEGTGSEKNKRMARFLIETQIEAIKDMMAYVKGLGVKTPLTDVNMIDNSLYIPIRQELDFVDTHAYWDHPNFPEGNWRMPYRYSLKQVVKDLGSMPTVQSGSRIFGKPFTITEYQYCFPNPYRAEGSLLMAAISGLQDWDGLWRFALAHSRENLFEERPVSGFDIFVDPVNLLGEQLMTLAFLRHDVKPAQNAVAFVIDDNYLKKEDGIPEGWNTFPKDYHQWALETRVGTFVARGASPDPKIQLAMTPQTLSTPKVPGIAVETLTPDFMNERSQKGLLPQGFNPPKGVTRSETGEIELDANARSFRLNTPRLKAVVLPEGGTVQSGLLTAKSLDNYGIVAAASVDGQSLDKSGRFLILHLTEINNAGMKYRNKGRNLVEVWGTSQRLVAKGRAEVSLAIPQPESFKVYGCDLSGKRVEEIAAQAANGTLSFLAETVRDSKARFLVYEVVKK